MNDYKLAQQKAREACRRSRHGDPVLCIVCGEGSVGRPGDTNSPFVKIEKGKYAHKKCRN